MFETFCSHFNPAEPRGPDGRWICDGSDWRDDLLKYPSPFGRARTLLGYTRTGAFLTGILPDFDLPTETEAQRFSHLLAAWNAAADLDDDAFRDRFIGGLVDDASLHHLREAAAKADRAQTFGDMADASQHITAVIKAVGKDRWGDVLDGLEEQAETAMPPSPAPTLSWSDIFQKILEAISPVGTANAQARGGPPRTTPAEELRLAEYNRIQNEFVKNGLRPYAVLTNQRPWTPTWEDIDAARGELNRQLAKRSSPSASLDDFLSPERSCPVASKERIDRYVNDLIALRQADPYNARLKTSSGMKFDQDTGRLQGDWIQQLLDPNYVNDETIRSLEDEVRLQQGQIADRISQRHGYDGHWKEFAIPGKQYTRNDYYKKILSVIRDPNALIKPLPGRRTAFYQKQTNVLVFLYPERWDGGSMYKPPRGIDYFNDLK